MDVEIREPAPADAEAAGRMHHAAWREAYEGLLPADFWTDDAKQRRIRMWTRLASDPPAGHAVRIAVRDGAVVGLVGILPTEPEPDGMLPVRDTSLFIYVLETEHGTGLAARLLESVLPAGHPAQLWVFEANPRARAFYEKHGFRADGARHVFGPELGNQPEIRMVR